ncbi:MAG: LysM peptidoglycan-binding domain-containing protein [Pelagimonas sp.]|jgi:nucleoid-associated protein YgaU|nr:LysM peptidoglycan-binding domain-containing protein [Pelagimonas sp.]
MSRFVLYATGFVGITLVLLWTVMAPTETSDQDINLVSRTNPDPLGLQPAIAPQPQQAAPVSPVPTSLKPALPAAVIPQANAPRGSAQAVTASLRPVARNIALPAELSPEQIATQLGAMATRPYLPETGGSEADVMGALRAMSYGIVKELQKPTDQTGNAPVATLTPAPVTPTAPVERTYLVQKGDSLPGIAFRYYGTTVAYFELLEANADLLTTPSDLRAGMTLRIPDIN